MEQVCNSLSKLDHGNLLSTEFDAVETVDILQAEQWIEKLNGNVLCIVMDASEDTIEALNYCKELFDKKKTKLIVFVCVQDNQSPRIIQSKLSEFKQIAYHKQIVTFHDTETGGNIHKASVVALYHSVSKSESARRNDPQLMKSLGFNAQPAVCSKQQFSYLQRINGDGWQRVLQRLADKPVLSSTPAELKLSGREWNDLIGRTLAEPDANDYFVYNMIRLKFLGSSLDADLQIDLSPIAAATNKKSDEDSSPDGRADHMVNMTIENIPPRLLAPRPPSSSSIRTLLDYGCAEGSITAQLGKQLGLPPDCIFGADVRVIASEGFTFIPLQTETETKEKKEEEAAILPQLRDQSIDLITSAMVFHHVINIKAVLSELRRVIAPR